MRGSVGAGLAAGQEGNEGLAVGEWRAATEGGVERGARKLRSTEHMRLGVDAGLRPTSGLCCTGVLEACGPPPHTHTHPPCMPQAQNVHYSAVRTRRWCYEYLSCTPQPLPLAQSPAQPTHMRTCHLHNPHTCAQVAMFRSDLGEWAGCWRQHMLCSMHPPTPLSVLLPGC